MTEQIKIKALKQIKHNQQFQIHTSTFESLPSQTQQNNQQLSNSNQSASQKLHLINFPKCQIILIILACLLTLIVILFVLINPQSFHLPQTQRQKAQIIYPNVEQSEKQGQSRTKQIYQDQSVIQLGQNQIPQLELQTQIKPTLKQSLNLSQSQSGLSKLASRDLYEFNISMDNMIVLNSHLFTRFPLPNSPFSNIQFPEYQRAIRLMEVVHNVNFKGELVFNHYNFYQTHEQKQNALSKIQKRRNSFTITNTKLPITFMIRLAYVCLYLLTTMQKIDFI